MKLTQSMFQFLLSMSLLLISVSVFAASGSETKLSVQDIAFLAKQMDMPTISEVKKKDTLERLSSLGRDDVLTLKKLWRSELLAKGTISKAEASSFAAIEKIETIFSDRVQELFGENATIFNISPKDLATVENSLSGNKVLSEAMHSVEKTFKSETSSSANAQLIVAASACYYDNNWPKWLPATGNSGTVYKGGGVGRVKNDPNEWPCDFVIYIPANRYTKTTGANSAAQSVVNYSGGLSASPSKDAVIVGYGRVLLYGVPTEDWVRNYILFKK